MTRFQSIAAATCVLASAGLVYCVAGSNTLPLSEPTWPGEVVVASGPQPTPLVVESTTAPDQPERLPSARMTYVETDSASIGSVHKLGDAADHGGVLPVHYESTSGQPPFQPRPPVELTGRIEALDEGR